MFSGARFFINSKFIIMKTFLLFLAILFLSSIISTNVEAQEKSKRALQGWFTSEYWSPIYCDGNMVDMLEGGTLRVHYVYHYIPGKLYKEKYQLKGEVTSSTGEVFKVSEKDVYYVESGTWYVTWKYNLKGNWGTHYIGEVTQDVWSGELTIGKTVCPNYNLDW